MTDRDVRVLHVITRLDQDGSSTNTLLTVGGLGRLFRQSLAFGPVRELPPLARDLGGSVELVEIDGLVRDPSPLDDTRALVQLYRLIRKERFDLVHTHTSKAGFLGRLAARRAGVARIVHTPHGHVFTGYAGRSVTRLFVLLERWAAHFTDRIVGLTEQEVRDHLQRGIGRPEQFVSIPSGVDVERVAATAAAPEAVKRDLGLPESAFLIGSAGRLEPVKGHRHLLEAFRMLATDHPSVHLVVAGEGALLPELQARAREAGLATRARFVGRRDDVLTLMRALDLFVLPSLNEGMGRALVEAMALGLPIVATRAGGIPEVLDDGAAGLLVEPGRAAALARGIERLLREPDLGARLGKAARERAHRYSVAVMLAGIEALYRGLLGLDGDHR